MITCTLDDSAYLLGLVCGRGTLYHIERTVVIDFPFRSIRVAGTTKQFNQREQMIISLDPVVNRLADFTGIRVKKINKISDIKLEISFQSNTNTWQNITSFYAITDNHHSFTLPDDINSCSKSYKVNFLKGLADTAGFITRGNADQQGRHRVYIEIAHNNWTLPVQVCKLLQEVDIPVQTITWGHPNMRGKKGWGKEHQVKVFAQHFREIGFTIEYKDQLLKEFAEDNDKKLKLPDKKFCNPNNKKIRKIKSISNEENHSSLPESLRGNHFDAYWQICCALGCRK